MILADHCVYEETVQMLRRAGYLVARLRDVGRHDWEDPAVFELAQRLQYILLTRDLGFAQMDAYPIHQSRGVVVMRNKAADNAELHQALLSLLENHSRDALTGCLAIVTPARYRIRRFQ